MRFLLYPPKAPISRLVKTKKSLRPQSLASDVPNDSLNKNDDGNDVARTYGQQCSPQCGCAVRFEATYDPNGSNRILSMTYDAKTVITTNFYSEKDGTTKLKPVYTTSNKPMMKECNCKTVHTLAQTVTESLPKMTLSQAQNSLEFLGVRSSPAFRYTALKNHNLLKTNHKSDQKKSVEETIIDVKEGHCFDLIEDALVACLKGYMPKSRRIISSTEYKRRTSDVPIKSQAQFMEEMVDADGDSNGLDPLRFVNAAKRRSQGLFYSSNSSSSSMSMSSSRSSLSPSSSMPPFHLMGSTDDSTTDTLSELKMEIKSLQQQEKNEDDTDLVQMDDWVSYVDERNS